jgi:hypothetical protein
MLLLLLLLLLPPPPPPLLSPTRVQMHQSRAPFPRSQRHKEGDETGTNLPFL